MRDVLSLPKGKDAAVVLTTAAREEVTGCDPPGSNLSSAALGLCCARRCQVYM